MQIRGIISARWLFFHHLHVSPLACPLPQHGQLGLLRLRAGTNLATTSVLTLISCSSCTGEFLGYTPERGVAGSRIIVWMESNMG